MNQLFQVPWYRRLFDWKAVAGELLASVETKEAKIVHLECEIDFLTQKVQSLEGQLAKSTKGTKVLQAFIRSTQRLSHSIPIKRTIKV